MRRIATAALVSSSLALGLVNCYRSPTAPNSEVACVTNNTAQVTFENRFTGQSLDILWNGGKLSFSPLRPDATSPEMTVAAGVTHTLRFQYAGTPTLACAQSSPVLWQCTTINYRCPS
jgi:hypothetical protein